MLPVDLTLSSSPRSPSSYSPSRMGSVAFPTSSTAAPPPASLTVTTCTGTLTHPTSTRAPRASLTYRCRTTVASSTPRSSRSAPVPNVEDFEVKGGGSATSCHHPLGGLHRGPMGVHTRTLKDEMSGTGRALRVGEGSLSDSIILYAKHGAARRVVAMLLLQRMRGLAGTTWKQWWGSLDRRVLRRRFLRLDFNSEDEMKQLSMSTDFLVQLSDGIFVRREASLSFATFSHQAVDFILGLLGLSNPQFSIQHLFSPSCSTLSPFL